MSDESPASPPTILGFVLGLYRSVSHRGYVLVMLCAMLLACTGVAVNRWIQRTLVEQRAYRDLTRFLSESAAEPNARDEHPQLISLASRLAGVDVDFVCKEGRCKDIDSFLLDVQDITKDWYPKRNDYWMRPCPGASPLREAEPMCLASGELKQPVPVLSALSATNLPIRKLKDLVVFSEWVREKIIEHELGGIAQRIFFMTPEGFVRTWKLNGDDELDLTLATDPTKDYRGRQLVVKYFGEAPRGSDEHGLCDTEPYLDVDLNGVVRTRYGPVRDVAKRVVGIAAVDYLPPRPKESPDPPDLDPKALVAFAPIVEAERLDLAVEPNKPGPAALLLGSMRERHRSDPSFDARPNMGGTVVLRAADESMVASVPLFKFDQHDYVLAMRITQPEVGEAFFFMVGSLLLSVVFIGRVIAGRRRLLKLDEESAVLRKLQSGVLRTHGTDLIVEANERAEELFDRPFPSIGAGEDGVGVSFASLHSRVVKKVSGKWKHGTTGRTDREHAIMFEEYLRHDLTHDRENGVGTDYYILLTGVRRTPPKDGDNRAVSPHGVPVWLHVHGAPMHNPSVGLEIFALVSVPSSERREQLAAFHRGGG